jgi:hypothetical protein
MKQSLKTEVTISQSSVIFLMTKKATMNGG